MSYAYIERTLEGDFEIVTLSRPKQRNALSEDLLRELLDALGSIGEGSSRGCIIAASGPVFSAGHDFTDMDGRDLEAMRALLDVCAEVMQTIQRMPQPVIAQVQGLATAAGCQLVASCDLAVAAESARFAVPGSKGGWFCTTPGVALTRAVGRKHALEMLLTGDPIGAHTAHHWGLVNQVVPEEQLESATRDLLKRCTRGSALSRGIGKQAFYRQIDLNTPDAYVYASEVMAAASQTEDAAENRRAFLEKRKAEYKNR